MRERVIAIAIAVLALGGCFMIQGRAEMVKRSKEGGVLALKGDHDKAMEDAKLQMASNCPGGYEIVGEEMAKVGEKTQGVEDSQYGKASHEKNSETVTSDVQEYRLTYECQSSEKSTVTTAGGESAS